MLGPLTISNLFLLEPAVINKDGRAKNQAVLVDIVGCAAPLSWRRSANRVVKRPHGPQSVRYIPLCYRCMIRVPDFFRTVRTMKIILPDIRRNIYIYLLSLWFGAFVLCAPLWSTSVFTHSRHPHARLNLGRHLCPEGQHARERVLRHDQAQDQVQAGHPVPPHARRPQGGPDQDEQV